MDYRICSKKIILILERAWLKLNTVYLNYEEGIRRLREAYLHDLDNYVDFRLRAHRLSSQALES